MTQQKTLEDFLVLVNKHHPDAEMVYFETSDQNRGYGFVAHNYSVSGSDERKEFSPAITVDSLFLDIDWNSIMNEDDHGYASKLVPSRGSYYAMKMFTTELMPEDLWETLNQFFTDGLRHFEAAIYTVGYPCDELKGAEKKEWEKLDQWFKDRGAAHKERIIVHHGEYDPNHYDALVS